MSEENVPLVENTPSLKKVMLIPLGVFLLLVLVLGAGFQLKDPHILPTVLIDRPFPEFELASLQTDQVLTKQDILGQVSLVNVWATWCPNCIIEHPELLRISREEGIPIFGINYNDDSIKARRWLKRYEDPFEKVMVDDKGKLGIDLGVYGAPETFLLDAEGTIQFKHIGIVDRRLWESTLSPLIDKLKQKESEQKPS
ncbi:MAG: cytochrome c biogenesis protein CcmG/thiol:disulfide interchange protein DsbE [Candidatus Azotimanducaceae bacterium]|jgi:cytochrome c biogenesis protein CcmG/thiol:disulfide interchange protein DsbE